MDRRVKFAFIATFFVFIGVIYSFIYPYYQFATKTLGLSPSKVLFEDSSVKRDGDRINILILGIPGGSHDGPLLSDSIMVAQYDMKKNHLTTIGLPRDVWSEPMKDKINSAYAYGEYEQEGNGLEFAKREIGTLLNMPIHYGAVISFSKFKQLIDAAGGIEVPVEESFTDDEFPIEGKENDECGGDPNYGCRYETISFQKGTQKMDGETALKFVRSRHAYGAEGSDFARNKRQQLVISALKSKIIATLQEDMRRNEFNKTQALYQTADKLVTRDVTNNEAAVIAKNIITKKDFKQTSLKLSQDIFEVPDPQDYEGKYVLIPVNNDYTTFHAHIECLFQKEDEKICKPSITEETM